MYPTLFDNLNQKDIEAYVQQRVYNALYWPAFFALTYSPFMKYEILKGTVANRVMAEVVAPGSPAPRKGRQVISKFTGDIPPIKVKRTLTEVDINKLNVYKAMANSDAERELLNMVYDDIDFCNNAVDGRVEWLALQALSYGKISFTSSNSAGLITTDDIDFKIPSANKLVTSAAAAYWTTGAKATNDPIANIRTVVNAAKAVGVMIRYIVMHQDKWALFQASTAVQKFAAPFAVKAMSLQQAPSRAVLNQVLTEEGLPQIITPIDTRVSFENANGTISTVDPWVDDRYVSFIPDLNVGKMWYGPLAEETNPPPQVIQVKRGPILLSKYSDVDPVEEHTKGEANMFPSLTNPDSIWILDTESHTTFGG